MDFYINFGRYGRITERELRAVIGSELFRAATEKRISSKREYFFVAGTFRTFPPQRSCHEDIDLSLVCRILLVEADYLFLSHTETTPADLHATRFAILFIHLSTSSSIRMPSHLPPPLRVPAPFPFRSCPRFDVRDIN